MELVKRVLQPLIAWVAGPEIEAQEQRSRLLALSLEQGEITRLTWHY